MLCCVGLFGGIAVGQSLGGPWTYVAPAVGFGIGLVADMKFMHGMRGKGGQRQAGGRGGIDAEPARPLEANDIKALGQVQDLAKN